MAIEEDDIKKQDEIEKIRKSRRDLEAAVEALPDINKKYDKLVSELCEGDDCLKSKVEKKFTDIDEKIKKIEESQNYFVCENCGYDRLTALSSFCNNCGEPIRQWTDEDGLPIRGWKHWTERNR